MMVDKGRLIELAEGSVILEKLRKVFNKYNPVGIYYADANNHDEYDLEIKKSVEMFNLSFNVDEFIRNVHKVFIETFDEETAGFVEKYKDLATEVYGILTDWIGMEH
ncbi:MAG: hypothetical protein A2921_03085 [Candidatus Magasanikbacteria bacterium RIFCSPLOWO2_01_FULL_43_20b]|nr:MAG: hypothetical protein A3I93_01980 [Candidatus Magasanikbacteria bacterium RIFCSPLOWO2_02_FULL_43_22]OGH72848.1 MAG: hypothetical protein A2921_03085 [Candidatus Magasanikbacteria bacterium RIFCSPLOWO2_01_FULL_43_20b]